MKFEKSAGAVIFRRQAGQNKFLLLHYPSMAHRSKKDYWDFVKGHVEKGEDEIATVRRETAEETGLADIELIGGFRATMKYFFRHKNQLIFKVAIFYLAETKNENINLSDEHNNFAWLSYQEARERLSFKNAKKILKTADEFLAKLKSDGKR